MILCFIKKKDGYISVSLAVPGGRIVGGRDAQRGQFPFQVSVQFCTRGACQHACGGVIVQPSTVITAAHCFTNAPALGSYKIIAGILSLNDDNPERQEVLAKYVLIHPQYQGGVNPHDIAIVKLANPLSFSSSVGPALLPAIDYHVSGEAIVTGWGSIGGSETPIMPSTLQLAPTPIINATACKTALDTLLNNAPHPLDLETNICTGPLTGGVSICTGDSGGPLVYVRFDNRSEVIGISSWGITPCGIVGAPSVYVKTNSYYDWIQDHLYD
ncbi:hypothetical protein NQ314_009081 [Rhamnusium bicolor]|uniref:Peptidase S1 domain-containing protein n=1 Tax=Rhamnusium bicolor TaxID=1586634 RepID=A0AAV8Y492_9CUCU|nr:hypothetical protein NQ314_009081 [Rhamnusium bicolor]